MTDDLAGAIKGMFALDSEQNGNKFQNQIIHQSGRYHANEKSNNAGTISPDQYNRTRNQLRYALQQILNDFPGYSAEINTQAQKAVMEGTPSPASSTTSPRPSESFLKILMLTSNPSGTGKLQLDKEHSRISIQIQNSPHANKFPIKSRQAVTLPQFTEALLDEKPAIVHFSGHGEISEQDKAIKNAMNRGLGFQEEETVPQDSTGIILTSDDGREPAFVPTNVIKRIFRTMVKRHKIPIKAVLFNSCYSEAQAQALAELVPHVIGTSWAIKDEAAIAFANGFYSFLTRTDDIEAAWDNGVTLAMAKGEPEERFIYFKDGERVI